MVEVQNAKHKNIAKSYYISVIIVGNHTGLEPYVFCHLQGPILNIYLQVVGQMVQKCQS
jgi:hypothetical protein